MVLAEWLMGTLNKSTGSARLIHNISIGYFPMSILRNAKEEGCTDPKYVDEPPSRQTSVPTRLPSAVPLLTAVGESC